MCCSDAGRPILGQEQSSSSDARNGKPLDRIIWTRRHRLLSGVRATWVAMAVCMLPLPTRVAADEALTGFDNQTNGFVADQSEFEKLLDTFNEEEHIDDGLGPVYNSTSCGSCHGNPVVGGTSQISVLRAGHFDQVNRRFVDPPGGSLIFQRAIDAKIQAVVPPRNEIRSLRMTTGVLGNGYLECIADSEIRRVQVSQPPGMQGAIVLIPAVVGPDGAGGFTFVDRVGRFGWKCQDASLMNFSAGAYLNEMGITSPLQPTENTSNGRPVAAFDRVADPEEAASAEHPFGEDVERFASFMRSTKAPPRDGTPDDSAAVARGQALFRQVKCSVCHVEDWTTVPAGTKLGDFVVPTALGTKTLHPYSDLMLHDVGTGDGIVQTQHATRPAVGSQKSTKSPGVDDGDNVYRTADELAEPAPLGTFQTRFVDTAHMIRTAPLWGLRTRPQLMHDGLSLTIEEAIERHANQAHASTRAFRRLSRAERDDLLAFLRTL